MSVYLRAGAYATSQEQLSPAGYRRVKAELSEKDQALVTEAAGAIEHGLKFRGGKYIGPGMMNELVAKLGMFNKAAELESNPDLRRRRTMIALENALPE